MSSCFMPINCEYWLNWKMKCYQMSSCFKHLIVCDDWIEKWNVIKWAHVLSIWLCVMIELKMKCYQMSSCFMPIDCVYWLNWKWNVIKWAHVLCLLIVRTDWIENEMLSNELMFYAYWLCVMIELKMKCSQMSSCFMPIDCVYWLNWKWNVIKWAHVLCLLIECTDWIEKWNVIKWAHVLSIWLCVMIELKMKCYQMSSCFMPIDCVYWLNWKWNVIKWAHVLSIWLCVMIELKNEMLSNELMFYAYWLCVMIELKNEMLSNELMFYAYWLCVMIELKNEMLSNELMFYAYWLCVLIELKNEMLSNELMFYAYWLCVLIELKNEMLSNELMFYAYWLCVLIELKMKCYQMSSCFMPIDCV